MTRLPDVVGIAADLVFIATPRILLSNCLAVYDRVMVPLNAPTLLLLLRDYDTDGFRLLVENRRIELCPSYTMEACYAHPIEKSFSKDAFLKELFDHPMIRDDLELDLVERIVADHLVVPMTPRYGEAKGSLDDAGKRFAHTASQPGYEALNMNRRVGLLSGVARINDLLQVGFEALEMDAELPVLLDWTYPRTATRNLTTRDVLTPLHRISNLPDLGTLASQEKWDNKNLLNVLLSQEGEDLRAWLRQNVTDDLDVREAYIAADRALPSRKKWLGWLRFGAVTAVSTAVSALLTDPVASAVVGAAVGAADQAWTPRVLDSSSRQYHPDLWLSFVSRSRARG